MQGCWPKNRLLAHHAPEGLGASKAEAILRLGAWRKADGVAFDGWDRVNDVNHKGLLDNNAEAPPDPLLAMGGGMAILQQWVTDATRASWNAHSNVALALNHAK